MIKTLRESKARLSELVHRAENGEEVIITVNGKPAAKLGPLSSRYPTTDTREWLQELREVQEEYTVTSASSDSDWDSLREDR
jgi:prevent-host-death family protein